MITIFYLLHFVVKEVSWNLIRRHKFPWQMKDNEIPWLSMSSVIVIESSCVYEMKSKVVNYPNKYLHWLSLPKTTRRDEDLLSFGVWSVHLFGYIGHGICHGSFSILLWTVQCFCIYKQQSPRRTEGGWRCHFMNSPCRPFFVAWSKDHDLFGPSKST